MPANNIRSLFCDLCFMTDNAWATVHCGAYMGEEIRFAVVELHTSPWNAHVTRALLESEGVPAFLANEHHVWANWSMSLMLGQVRLLVRAEHLARTCEILDMRDRGELQAALEEQWPYVPPSCGHCGSTMFISGRNWMSIVLSLMLLVTCKVIYPPGKQTTCASCGKHEYDVL